MIVSTAATGLEQRGSTTRASRKPVTDIPYHLDDFLDDQQRLAANTAYDAPLATPPHIREVLDGRLLVMHLDPLLVVSRTDSHARKTFFWKYGSGPGACRLSRFRMVLDFLDQSRTELSKAGVVVGQQPMAIREEFVRYLLAWKTGPGQQRFPKSVLLRFLDEWGHRWM